MRRLGQTDKQNPEVTSLRTYTHTYGTSTPSHPRTNYNSDKSPDNTDKRTVARKALKLALREAKEKMVGEADTTDGRNEC